MFKISHDIENFHNLIIPDNVWHNNLPGGLSDNRMPSEFDEEQLIKGILVELEHTKQLDIAQKICQDHLTEDPNYYKKLEKMEKKDKDKETDSED